jgi:hypothetical protein
MPCCFMELHEVVESTRWMRAILETETSALAAPPCGPTALAFSASRTTSRTDHTDRSYIAMITSMSGTSKEHGSEGGS